MASVFLQKEHTIDCIQEGNTKSTIICTIMVIFKASLSFLMVDIQASQGHAEI